MDIGAMVRAARKSVGLTQAEAADRAGVSPRALWTLERGGGHMETLRRVADAIELRIAGLPPGKTLGARIQAARQRRGWSREKLAIKAAVSIPTVDSVEADTGQVASVAKVLDVISTQVRVRKPERAAWSGGGRDERFTPRHFLATIEAVFGPISIDPCAHPSSNVEAERYLFIEDDGLATRWSGRLAFVNPPFSAGAKWLERCHRAWADGEVDTVVCLLPARTHIQAHHDYVHCIADTLFLKGRLHFDNAAEGAGFPLGLMLATWGASDVQVAALVERIEGALVPGRARRVALAA